VVGIACNVADADAVSAAFAQVKAMGYRPDVVINNACVPTLHPKGC
jgi:NAD(P)-dependent dehydrogenase (short-subunit alcohol dehydrogenase family)